MRVSRSKRPGGFAEVCRNLGRFRIVRDYRDGSGSVGSTLNLERNCLPNQLEKSISEFL